MMIIHSYQYFIPMNWKSRELVVEVSAPTKQLFCEVLEASDNYVNDFITSDCNKLRNKLVTLKARMLVLGLL